MSDAILVLNAGSSSLKFSALGAGGGDVLARGQVEGIGTAPRFVVRGPAGEVREEQSLPVDFRDHEYALAVVLDLWRAGLRDVHLAAVGHRVVHGGTKFAAPVRIDAGVLAELEALVPLAPLHQPHNLAAVKAVTRRAPDLPQVACFDTAFHRTQPEVAQRFGLPRRLTDEGVRRYGFHGLSYEYIASVLPGIDPEAAAGRTVVAHLGNGASMCALLGGKSVATTMSFTPADGLVMGTRCGSLDPGVLLDLMTRHGMDAAALEHLIYHESGLLGVSGVSGDMRELLASDDPRAAEAVDLFVYRVGRELGSLAAALGGLDALVFTGGIGENAAAIRDRVVRDAAWLGPVRVHVVPTDEERMIATHTRQVLGLNRPEQPPDRTPEPTPMAATKPDDLLARYECNGFRFPDRDYYDRHVVFDHVVSMEAASQRERFEAVARTIRDVLAQRWVKTAETYDRKNPKQVYYLSMEFLIGRSLLNNIANLGLEPFVREDLRSDPRQDWKEVQETEPDAGLGNGGLGRLAACFVDSLATLGIPATGYGLRYDYGIFRQEIADGRQVEHPDPWLTRPDPWEVVRAAEAVTVPLATTFDLRHGEIVVERGRPMQMVGIPYDRPVVGYGGGTINTLRLWKAGTGSDFDFAEFSGGDFFGAVSDRVIAESLTRVLYPDDSTPRGRSLRFLQEYFLVRCSLADIVARFRRRGNDWAALPDKVAVQLNDTHPAMAVPELLRILLDEAGLGWDRAWDLSVRTLAYTNHTLLPEALEKWPVELFRDLLPRHLDLVYEINRRFLGDVQAKYPGDDARAARVSLIEEGGTPKVRMANLAIVGTYSTNGVAAIHSELLRTKTVPDFAELFPDRFNNKTNGVTPRRWLLLANPDLAKLLTDAVGDGWVTDLSRLRKADALAGDAGFRDKFLAAKRGAKARFVDWIKQTAGVALDPDTLFDVQIKRIHEYKRQLLNAVQCVVWYNRLRENPGLDVPPRTVLFAGKAAPAYHLAKVIIRLVTGIGKVVNADPATRRKLRVEFLPNYSCTLAEHLIPAADVSEQISTAGYEASGTSNMKFMMNGALTVGTRDGANIEIAEEAGEENVFMFGLTADQVLGGRGWYSPHWHYENEPEARAALDLIFGNHFSPDEPGIFEPIRETLLTRGDYYMHLADLKGYVETQQAVAALYRDRAGWARKAVHNVARSGKFSSDRTIAEYARDVWRADRCPVD